MGKSKKRKKPSHNPARQRVVPQEHSHEDGDAWIHTEPTPDGTGYMVTLIVDEDRSISLERPVAMEYAYTVLKVVSYAEYDAAVLKQITQRVDRESAMQIVVDLRKDRPEPDFAVMTPLSLEPGVNTRGEAFVVVKKDGEQVGTWSVEQAREHALTILEAISVAELDEAYLRCLKGVIGVEGHIAQAMVGDLQEFRP